MEERKLVKAMAKGQVRDGTPETSTYCIFSAVAQNEVHSDGISGNGDPFWLELKYLENGVHGWLRITPMGTNGLVEESVSGAFLSYLEDKQVKYFGQLVLHALRFKIEAMGKMLDSCSDVMKAMEDDLDRCIDNSGTYKILDFRRDYTMYGDSLINVKEILTRIGKGYYPMEMENSYILQGEVNLAFEFVERRYDLFKNTIIKDLDTYTSIINNNINRNARLLSIISLAAVVMNFVFGSLLAVNPILGIVGGVAIGGLSVGASFFYRRGMKDRLPQGTVPLTVKSIEEKETTQSIAPQQ